MRHHRAWAKNGRIDKGIGICEGDGAMECYEGSSNNDGTIVDGARGLRNVMMEIPKEVWSSVLSFIVVGAALFPRYVRALAH
jgi:hypothetical protein